MRFRVYLKPFDEDGVYLADWLEVTGDVNQDSLSDLRQVIDDDQYDVGVFKFSDWNLKLRNEHGLYSAVGELRSVFKYKRSDSKVRVTWQFQNEDSVAGVSIPGECIPGNDEVEVFEGLLSDEATETDIKDQSATFKVRGRESIFARAEVPFGDIANGDTVKELLMATLDQTMITDLLGLNEDNINPFLDAVIDDVSDYENRTVKELIDDLLLISNSVLTIRDGSIYVSSREEGAEVRATFYGQSSNEGIENLVDLYDVRTGFNKMFNLATWAESSLSSRDIDSITRNGIRKKEFDFSQVTNDVTKQSILDAFCDEFGQIKSSFSILTPITEEMLELTLLDKVIVDYPTVLYPPPGQVVPIYGISKYGEAVYPYGAWSLTILTSDSWKIMGKTIKCKTQQIEFILRKV